MVLRLYLFNINNRLFWLFVAECFKDRTDVQCLHRWQKVLNPELVKGPWSKEVIVALCCLLPVDSIVGLLPMFTDLDHINTPFFWETYN